MAWDEWLDLPSIKALSQHASATLAAFACTWVIGFAAKHSDLTDATRCIIEFAEEMVLVGLVLWFIIQMALVMWKGRMRREIKNSPNVA